MVPWSSVWNSMLQLVYPRLCEGCGKSMLTQELLLCISCSESLPFTHYHHIAENETARRLAGRFPFNRATSLAYYTKEGLLPYLLQEFKYKGNKKVGDFLGSKLGFALKRADWIQNVDLIIPVPLYPAKLKLRGYNQSELVGEKVGEILGIPLNSSSLIRVINTSTQTHKTREERADNMKNAFGVLNPRVLEYRHILLLDDVLTTGATIEGCVQALLKVEGVVVSISTIGIAVH